MSGDLIDDYITQVPKCELHLHIEGTLEPAMVQSLAAKNHIKLPDLYSDREKLQTAYDSFQDLQGFLDLYYQGMACLIEKQDFTDLAEAYFAKAEQDHIRHVEAFFDPQAHTSRGVPIQNVIHGLLEAKVPQGMTVSWIMCFLRDMPEEDALDIYNQALPFLESRQILGIGLDSAEVNNPPSKFSRVYAKARQAGFRIVAHAGEEGPPEYVWEALNDLQVERIDHGIRCLEDEALCRHLVEKRIPLTVCPLSNVSLKVVSALEDLPLPQMLERGLVITLNSDDPAYFSGYLLDNMKRVQAAFKFDIQTWKVLARNGVEASFVGDDRRRALMDEIVAVETLLKIA